MATSRRSVRFEDEVWEKLSRLASRAGVSNSAMLHLLVNGYRVQVVPVADRVEREVDDGDVDGGAGTGVDLARSGPESDRRSDRPNVGVVGADESAHLRVSGDFF